MRLPLFILSPAVRGRPRNGAAWHPAKPRLVSLARGDITPGIVRMQSSAPSQGISHQQPDLHVPVRWAGIPSLKPTRFPRVVSFPACLPSSDCRQRCCRASYRAGIDSRPHDGTLFAKNLVTGAISHISAKAAAEGLQGESLPIGEEIPADADAPILRIAISATGCAAGRIHSIMP